MGMIGLPEALICDAGCGLRGLLGGLRQVGIQRRESSELRVELHL
jgi:hypothetical protein